MVKLDRTSVSFDGQWRPFFFLLIAFSTLPQLHAENGADAWLRYQLNGAYPQLPSVVVATGNESLVRTAQSELVHAFRSMYARTVRIERDLPNEDAIVLGTAEELHQSPLSSEAYRISYRVRNGHHLLTVAGGDGRGVLYGVFRLLERLGTKATDFSSAEESAPRAPIRWVNQWDNMDGSIERGYAGRSIFFNAGEVRADLTRSWTVRATPGFGRCERLHHQQCERRLPEAFAEAFVWSNQDRE